MPVVTIRTLSVETHRALKLRAAQHGRGIEAEARQILDDVALPPTRVRIGSELAAFGERFGGIDIASERDRSFRATRLR